MVRSMVWGLVLLVPSPAAWSGEEKKADTKNAAAKGLKVEAELTADDPMDGGKHYKVHSFKMKQGQTYQIDMVSLAGNPRKFNPLLVLKDSKGKMLTEDDNSGGFPHAQITFTAPKDDTYQIVATTLSGGTGKYRLTVGPGSTAMAELKSLQSDLETQAKKIFSEVKGNQEQARAKLVELAVPYVEKLEKLIKSSKEDRVVKMAENEVYGVLDFLIGTPAASKLIRGMLERATDKARKGQLSLMLGQGLREQYEVAYRKGEKEHAAKIAAEAEELLAKTKAEGGPAAKQADDALFLFQKLSVGKVAPDIEGEDMEGKKFKLSDYRGKVVVLDYWAFWWGACVAMFPHERSLVSRMSDRPFALIGVNADDNREEAQKRVEKEKLNWRSFSDGNQKITNAWRVRYFPTIYVLDQNGVIRYRDVRDQAMDRAVEELLKEMGSKGK
jgi:peroxiredoxin